ncbi:DMT family transporter [Azospirillum sp. SYSU D00513]|uniref:DMT family transporter n=1 Tax=Azospirillum sp. SYSU D00513 TaxID=2812561 RepID=UPI001A95BB69|nr:DMT family transporter [Azospirillum sp. SYSU D00513]
MSAAAPAGTGQAGGSVLVKYLLIAAVSLFWGMNWPAVKIILTQVPPLSLRALGFTAGAVLMLGMAWAAGLRLRVPAAERPALLAAGLCNVLAFNLCTAFGQQLMATSQAAIIAFTMPVWATLLSIPLLGDRPGVRQWIGLACGMAGLLVLLGPGALSAPPAQLLGPAIMLTAAISWALGTIVMKRRSWTTHPMVITGWQYAACALPMLVLAPMLENPPALEGLELRTMLALGWHLLFSLCLAQTLWYVTVRRLRVAEAAVSTLLIPVVGVSGAVLILGDAVTPQLAAALLLILAAVAFVLSSSPGRR